MSDFMHSGTRSGAAAMPFAAGNLAPVIEVAARTGSACSRAYLAWQDEVLRFTSARLQRDAELGTNLLKCDKWADAARLQQSWMTEAVEDYVSQVNRLFELAAHLTDDVTRSTGEAADVARATGRDAGHHGSAAGEAVAGMAEGVSRFTRSAAEHSSATAEETRKAAERAGQQAMGMAEEGRKATDDVAQGSKDRAKRR